jgi:hypothetical protein
MKSVLSVVLFIFCAVNLNGQDCHCPKNQSGYDKSDTVFHFKNNKAVALCGYKEESKNRVYTEFVLSVCKSDTILGFWNAREQRYLNFKSDTLCLTQPEKLPIGKNFAYKECVWSTEKIYFKHQDAIITKSINRGIPKYNSGQLKLIMDEYEKKPPNDPEKNIILANKLFMAAVSGSKKAESYFLSFRDKFSIDGAYAEEYNNLKKMLSEWNR